MSTILTIQPAHPDDCAPIAACMRTDDRREVAVLGQTPTEALQESLAESSLVYTVLVEGQPAAMFGLMPLSVIGNHACIWMLTGDPIADIAPITFVRESRQIINRFLDLYPVLENWVDTRYTQAIKWLTLCGAHFDETREFGPERIAFRHFTIGRQSRCAM